MCRIALFSFFCREQAYVLGTHEQWKKFLHSENANWRFWVPRIRYSLCSESIVAAPSPTPKSSWEPNVGSPARPFLPSHFSSTDSSSNAFPHIHTSLFAIMTMRTRAAAPAPAARSPACLTRPFGISALNPLPRQDLTYAAMDRR
jgi:hypothetical protein